VSAVFQEPGEAFERSLFERRARARQAGAGVPSLDAVLRAARVEARETSSGKGRAWRGLILAAACLLTVMKARPHERSTAEITADVDPRTASIATDVGGVCEERQISSSSGDSLCTSVGVAPPPPVVPDSRTCDAPLATFDPSTNFSCDGEEGNRTCSP
jgi:hypothetical protein